MPATAVTISHSRNLKKYIFMLRDSKQTKMKWGWGWRRREIKQKRQCQMIVHDIEYHRGSLAVNSTTIHICTKKVNCEMTIMRQNEEENKISTKRWSLSQLDCLTACMRRWMSDMSKNERNEEKKIRIDHLNITAVM